MAGSVSPTFSRMVQASVSQCKGHGTWSPRGACLGVMTKLLEGALGPDREDFADNSGCFARLLETATLLRNTGGENAA